MDEIKGVCQMAEEELLAGELARSRCEKCGGSGVSVVANHPDETVVCPCVGGPARLWKDANLPGGPLAGATLASLDWQALSPAVVKAVQGYANRLEGYLATGVGLVLIGDVGTGKTHVAVGMAKIALGLGIGTLFLTMDDLLNRTRRTYDGTESDVQEVMDKLAKVPLLVLDDLGVETPTEWARGIYTLVNRRWLERKPLIVTTNLEPDDLEERLGTLTISRLWGSCYTMRFNGADYRARQLSAWLAAVRDS